MACVVWRLQRSTLVQCKQHEDDGLKQFFPQPRLPKVFCNVLVVVVVVVVGVVVVVVVVRST